MMDIEYAASTRARSVRITVLRGGIVRVIYPHRLARSRVESWVNTRREWIACAREKMLTRGGIPLPAGAEGKKAYQTHKKMARQLVDRSLAQHRSDFVWKKVRIVNARTRWGSCSTRGTLSFNWRIIYLAPEVQQYLIVHELCHLKHHNHSVDFWNCVAQYVPDYAVHKKALKRYHF